MSNEVKVCLPKYAMSYMNKLSQHLKYFSKTSSCSTIKWEKYGKEWEGIVCEEVKICKYFNFSKHNTEFKMLKIQ